MVVDSHGRICLGKQLCEEFGYNRGKKLRFLYEGNKIYRLVREEDCCSSDKLCGYSAIVDDKSRIFVPKEIRDMYTKHVLVYGTREVGCLFLEFQNSKRDEKLITVLEKLEKLLEKT